VSDFQLLGFYPEPCTIGDMLPRGIGEGPDQLKAPHPTRWCPQCKAVFRWQVKGFDPRCCAVCRHDAARIRPFSEISKLMGALCGYQPLEQLGNRKCVLWSQYRAEFESIGFTAERFLAGARDDLAEFWQHLAGEIKRARGAA